MHVLASLKPEAAECSEWKPLNLEGVEDCPPSFVGSEIGFPHAPILLRHWGSSENGQPEVGLCAYVNVKPSHLA